VASARAVATVLSAASAGGGPAVAVPVMPAPAGIRAATLGVFGARAASLTLRAAPAGAGGASAIGASAGRMAGFPDQPERFVGRYGLMTTMSTALRPGSGSTAVLLQGMPGIGKTACALELAYLRQDQFSAVAFWRPPADRDPDVVLQSLADALHRQLGPSGAGFGPLPRWGRRRWSAYAPPRGHAGQPRPRRRRQPRGTPAPGRQLEGLTVGSDFRCAGRARWRVPDGGDQSNRASGSR
jgi:hypothetical protein